jgi:hypothetical protein
MLEIHKEAWEVREAANQKPDFLLYLSFLPAKKLCASVLELNDPLR